MPDYKATGHGPAGLDPRAEAADALDAAVEARQAEILRAAAQTPPQGNTARDMLSEMLCETGWDQDVIWALCIDAANDDDAAVSYHVAASHIADAAWRLAERELGARPMSIDELRRREGGA